MKNENQQSNMTDARMGRADAAPSCLAPPDGATPNLNAGSEEFISKNELARRLKKSIRTISYWQRRGILPYVKCRRSVYFDWPAIAAHLERNFHVCRKQPQPQESPQLQRIPVIGIAVDPNPEKEQK